MFHHFFVENYIRIDQSHPISLHRNSMLSLVTDYQGRSPRFGPAIQDISNYTAEAPWFSYQMISLDQKKALWPLHLWMEFNCLKARATQRRQLTFCRYVPRNSWYSLYRPQKDERLSRPSSHPVVLNTGPLDQESSALTTSHLLKI